MPSNVPADVVSALQEGRQAYVAVPSKDGPHVTPELYAWFGERLWFAAATSTLKAKVLSNRPVAGAVVAAGGRTAVLHGDVEILDPRRPLVLARRVRELPGAAAAMAHFAVRNAPDLLAFGADLVQGRLGRGLPPLRVLHGLRPSSAALIENDRLVLGWGGWTTVDDDQSHVVPAGGAPAVIAVTGPVAVPCRWFPDQDLAYVSPPLLGLAGCSGTFPVGIVTDAYGRPGPAAKQGSLIRGRARLGAEAGFLEVETEREVSWDGVVTG